MNIMPESTFKTLLNFNWFLKALAPKHSCTWFGPSTHNIFGEEDATHSTKVISGCSSARHIQASRVLQDSPFHFPAPATPSFSTLPLPFPSRPHLTLYAAVYSLFPAWIPKGKEFHHTLAW